MAIEKDYVLGTHDDEIARLGLQNAVWRPRAADAWRRAGFTRGQTIVDLGCGPGWATLDLADVVGSSGRVVAIDRSRRFLDALEAAARGRGARQIEVHELDLDENALPGVKAHGIWSRWVYAFVKNPKGLLSRAAAMLDAGGTIVMHEYVDYRAWRTSPRSEIFEGFVAEVMASWRASGGEPDIALELPAWLGELGFAIRSLTPLVEVARKGDFTWQWPRAFVDVGIRRLVDLGRIDEAHAATITSEYERVERTANAFQVTPTVLEIIATQR